MIAHYTDTSNELEPNNNNIRCHDFLTSSILIQLPAFKSTKQQFIHSVNSYPSNYEADRIEKKKICIRLLIDCIKLKTKKNNILCHNFLGCTQLKPASYALLFKKALSGQVILSSQPLCNLYRQSSGRREQNIFS